MAHPARFVPDTVCGLLAHGAVEHARRSATRHRSAEGGWRSTSYAGLWQEVAALASGLVRLGLQPGESVAILAPTCRKWQLAEFAVMTAGGVAVGIDAHAPPDQIAYIVAHSEARWLIIDDGDRLQQLPIEVRSELANVVVMEPSLASRAAGELYAWEEVFRAGDSRPVDFPTPLGKHPATLLYTSGTTGKPKGILYDHEQLMVACRPIVDAFPEVVAGDRVLCWLPMAPLFQRMMNLVALACGAEIWFIDDPRNVVEAAQQIEPAVFVGVPRFYEKLHEAIQEKLAGASRVRRTVAKAALRVAADYGGRKRSGETVSGALRAKHALADVAVLRRLRGVLGRKIKFMITGSAATPAWLSEFFQNAGLPLFEAYGLSENTVPMAINRPSAFRLGSVGQPLPAHQIKLADDGQVLVRGPGVFRGYHRDESSRNELFTPDGFYRTGDLGRFDGDGFLHLLGRTSELIKTSTGRRVSPVRVEAAYAQSPCFDQVVVFGEGRKHLVGLLALKPNIAEEIFGEETPRFLADVDLTRLPRMKDTIDRELECFGRELAGYERIARYAVLSRPLSIAEGELTTTLKVRRDLVAQKFAAVIDSLYADMSPASVGNALRGVPQTAAKGRPSGTSVGNALRGVPRTTIDVAPPLHGAPQTTAATEADEDSRVLIAEADEVTAA